MNSVSAATLEKYNANNRGKSVGDCVKRGISLAFDIPYSEVGKILNAKMKELRRSAWNIQPVFEPVIRDLGCSNWKEGKPGLTVDEFVDTIADPTRTYLLLVGKKYPSTSHLVCVRDGKIWDSWDCRNYEVTRYYIIDDTVQHKEFTDIKDHINELRIEYFSDEFDQEVEKQMAKYKMDVDSDFFYDDLVKSYTILAKCKLILFADKTVTKERRYSFEIAFPLEPTMTVDEAREFMRKTGKIRIYDRFYAIAQQEKQVKEEYDMLKQLGKDPNDRHMWCTAQETKFLNTLPGWARALIKTVDISNPGQYHNSYTIVINKLPGDETHPNYTNYLLEDYDAEGIRKQLDRYAKYGEIEGIDYYKDW